MIKKILGLVLLILFKIIEIIIIVCEVLKEFIIILYTFLYAGEHMQLMALDVGIHLDSSIIYGRKVSRVQEIE